MSCNFFENPAEIENVRKSCLHGCLHDIGSAGEQDIPGDFYLDQVYVLDTADSSNAPKDPSKMGLTERA